MCVIYRIFLISVRSKHNYRDVYIDYYKPDLRESAIRRFLAAPIAIRSREDKEKELRKLLGEK